ncbi:putative late membrane protein [Diachasmimorpha longicaudata entomopoxvirus]|uniref:Putative late membrane protein n=1 Tax=Diachasmimorpha longicaudata entomopoxvirus TaxID=109981 RepID=A0A7R5WNM0_9POXV|nr:putative late membrane protein [Diachasmimorpha longicaudata entomopoxvirus]AKS26326.1 putative late membrane protein [Diachasmimorpha longicaudata entomopoxvirus]
MEPDIKDSKSFEHDKIIRAYCRINSDDPRCRCILHAEKMNQTALASNSPYYCWYAPCRDSDSFMTSILSHEKTYCNINLCTYHSDYIKADSGTLEITNKCKSSFSTNTEELLLTPLRESYIPPSYFEKSNILVIAGLLTIILLL